jgi:UDP-N-acetylmuramate dehydrogenase
MNSPIDRLRALREACPTVREKEPLAKHTSFAIGGPADYYADVQTLAELSALRRLVTRDPLPVFFIGAGSNLLVSDRGIRGLVLHLQGDLRKIDFDGARVHVFAGAWMPVLAKQCAERGLAGTESLVGVPGTVGGGLVMNAGTRDGVLGDVVESVEALDEQGRVCVRPAAEAGFSYRHSNLQEAWISGATLRLKAEERSSIMARVESYLQYRSRTQPLATSNCGSVFKNPPGAAAAALIERAGFKGKTVGGARVSDRHANFIINEGRATAADVQELIRQIQQKVFEDSGARLEPEVKRVGDW